MVGALTLDSKDLARLCSDPLAVDVAGRLEERRVVELQRKRDPVLVEAVSRLAVVGKWSKTANKKGATRGGDATHLGSHGDACLRRLLVVRECETRQVNAFVVMVEDELLLVS